MSVQRCDRFIKRKLFLKRMHLDNIVVAKPYICIVGILVEKTVYKWITLFSR
jgi:hypothetical protein